LAALIQTPQYKPFEDDDDKGETVTDVDTVKDTTSPAPKKKKSTRNNPKSPSGNTRSKPQDDPGQNEVKGNSNK
jgi:hypothetical protein